MGVYSRGFFDTDRDVNRGRALLPMSILGLCELPKIEYQIITNDFNWSSASVSTLMNRWKLCIMILRRPLFVGFVSLRLVYSPCHLCYLLIWSGDIRQALIVTIHRASLILWFGPAPITVREITAKIFGSAWLFGSWYLIALYFHPLVYLSRQLMLLTIGTFTFFWITRHCDCALRVNF